VQAAKYGERYICGHRADLMASLLRALPPECVRTGSRVVAFEETTRDVRVELAGAKSSAATCWSARTDCGRGSARC
jgi:hypothetical protein